MSVPSSDPRNCAPRVAVVIVNYNSGNLLQRCLHDLERQTYRAFKVIVVDNDSTDDSLQQARQRYPQAHFIELDRNVGFAEGNNIGARAASDCEWIACLNPDAFAAPDWLASLLQAAQDHPEFSMFGSKLVMADRTDRLDGTGDSYHVSGAAWRRDHRKDIRQGCHVSGEIFAPCAAASLYRRDAFEAAGGFDADYFCYFEDVDLAFRMRLLGHRCYYVADAVVWHMGSAITGYQSPFTIYHGHRNLVWTYVKDMPLFLFIMYLPLHLFLNLMSIALYVSKGQAQAILRAKRDAIAGLRSAWRKRTGIQQRRTVSSIELWRQMKTGLFSLFSRP